jgi:hypothetical protein
MTRFRVVEHVVVERVWDVLAYTKHEAVTIVNSKEQEDKVVGKHTGLVSEKEISTTFVAIDEVPSDRIR